MAREELLAAQLRLAPEACVSHESALELLGLSDIVPDLIHLSVPRARRKLSRRSGVALHTTTRPLDGSDVVARDGMRLTGPARTIADVARLGWRPSRSSAPPRRPSTAGLPRRGASGRRPWVEATGSSSSSRSLWPGQAGEVRLDGCLPPGGRDAALPPRGRPPLDRGSQVPWVWRATAAPRSGIPQLELTRVSMGRPRPAQT